MKRIVNLFGLLSGLMMILLLAACKTDEIATTSIGSEITAPGSAQIYTTKVSALEEQSMIDQELLAEVMAGYTFEDPFVVVNPYGTAPLSALVIFDTDTEEAVCVTVKGHKEKDNISVTFPEETQHILPIAGLYAGQDTEVELTLSDGTAKTLLITTDHVDTSIAKAVVNKLDQDFYDYSQLTFVCYNYGTLAYDSEGDLRYYSTFPALPIVRLSNGRFASYTADMADPSSGTFSGVVEFDLCGRVYNRYDLPGGAHHEILELANGNLLVGTSHDDLSVINCCVAEIERDTGNIVWMLDLCDILDREDGRGLLYEQMNKAGFSVWFHNNSLAYDEATDSLLISGRIVDAVICIEKSTKTLKWILGTNEGWKKTDPSLFFTPVVEDGKDFEWQFAQHNVSILPDGDNDPATLDILLFDNGCSRAKFINQKGVAGKDVYSRAAVYHINTTDMTVSQKWEYGKARGASWYSAYISGATYYPKEDAYWICSGGIQYDAVDDNYDLSVTSFNGDLEVQYSTLIDAVQGNELKYELSIGRNAYRCARMKLYSSQNASLNLYGEHRTK